MNYCKTCKYWDKVSEELPPRRAYQGYSDGGYCTHEKLIEGHPFEVWEPDVLIYSYQEGGSFWVGPDFGCVHHEPKP